MAGTLAHMGRVSVAALSRRIFTNTRYSTVRGCTWSAHTIHIKSIGDFGTTTCDARSTNQPTKQLDQSVETCVPVLQPHLSPQTQLLAAGGRRKQKQRVGCGLARVWCQETPALQADPTEMNGR